MAKTVIKNAVSGIVRKVSQKNFFYSKISFKQNKTTVKEVLPFRVKFTNIGITTIIAPGAQPIGVAIIGYNNYIL